MHVAETKATQMQAQQRPGPAQSSAKFPNREMVVLAQIRVRACQVRFDHSHQRIHI